MKEYGNNEGFIMTYLSFVSDSHLLSCINILYSAYNQCKQTMTLEKFYSNKIDPIKFVFDMKFNNIQPKEYIDLEILLQNDKTISNAIGLFHQNMLGGISGFENMGTGNGCDIKKMDNTIYAEVKNKHNTMNSSSAEATYQKLQNVANEHPNATCYLVEIIAKKSQDMLWAATLNNQYYCHSRIRKISADKFYALATGIENAFKELCQVLPRATNDYLNSYSENPTIVHNTNTIYNNLQQRALDNDIDFFSQLISDNFSDYNGF